MPNINPSSILHLEWNDPSAGPNGEFCVDSSGMCTDSLGNSINAIVGFSDDLLDFLQMIYLS